MAFEKNWMSKSKFKQQKIAHWNFCERLREIKKKISFSMTSSNMSTTKVWKVSSILCQCFIMKVVCQFLLLTRILVSCQLLTSQPVFLDVDEMNLVQYDVKIGDQPIVLNDKDPQPPVQVFSISLKI